MKKNYLSKKRRGYIGLMKTLMGLCAGITCAVTLFIIIYVLCKGLPHVSWNLLSTKPSYLGDNIGILPDILNTLYMILATLIVVLPLGVGAAVYLNEYAANKRVVGIIEYAAETLSGIPSIIFGLVGMLFFCQFLDMKTSLAAGAMTLVIMNLPTVMRTTQESLKTVPDSYREGSFGLGAGKLRTVFAIVLPTAIPGILAGVILAVGRIVGETAALLYTSGTVAAVPDSLMGSGRTLSVHMYSLTSEALYMDQAYATAVVLLVVVIAINAFSSWVAKRIKKV